MTTVPSHVSYRYLLPGKSRFEHWRGVYYQCRMSPQSLRNYKIRKQNVINEKINNYHREYASVESVEKGSDICNEHEPNGKGDYIAWNHYTRMCRCNDYSLVSHAMNNFEVIRDIHCHSSSNQKTHAGKYKIPPHAYQSLIRSFSAVKLAEFLCETQCEYDETDAIKKLGEYQGPERVDCASVVAEFLMETIRGEAVSRSKVSGDLVSKDTLLQVHIINALMEVMLTGGFRACQQVFQQTYDYIGQIPGLHPTLDTYLHTMRALCLCGKTTEAESIFNWLKRTLGPQGLGNDIRPYNILLEGYREIKDYESCDSLMKELMDARFPTIMPGTAECYLRSIIDRAYTPLSGDMSYYGQPYHAELKRIPLIMQRLATHGITENFLTPPVLFHVNDAMISYKISDKMKYKWNRSMGQFNFLNMRRTNQYVDDVQELTSSGGLKGNPQEKDQKGGTGQIPYYGRHGQKKSWEMLPSDSLFYQFHVEEQMRDTKMESKNTLVATDIYSRSQHWMHDVPQTRYDQLQSHSNVDFKNIGVRRHLNPQAPGQDESLLKDEQIISSAANLGKKAAGKRKIQSVR
ncbi:Pentatricopeptide repeat-containing protein [Perkinsela sp. CCAP 1560/4]|nr:Pentatricopeptide repeat-containing protein [Perkinsela sp. CCAP 1560/4]|eukprot:KNH09410.1 Pentatricopeptide repeat-containing protein [Perkinsela sp. CCAP 1560/4]